VSVEAAATRPGAVFPHGWPTPCSWGPDMLLTETPLAGAYVIEPELHVDERGFFARLWSQDDFAKRNLETRIVQCSISYNRRAGTLRGMHYQAHPYQEVKIVRCTRGALFDVIIDLRRGSPTFAQHFAIVLSASNRKMLYIPHNLAHGFQTLEDDTEVTYQMSEFYRPEYARGVRWNDPAFKIEWPHADTRIMAERDSTYLDFAGSAEIA
jgi:dTDP-4-dehydrorhamnose 3,5-epimerase